MMDNRKVKDNHQEGIERVKQRKGDMQKGQGGSMAGGWKHEGGGKSDSFKRSGDSLTPRRA